MLVILNYAKNYANAIDKGQLNIVKRVLLIKGSCEPTRACRSNSGNRIKIGIRIKLRYMDAMPHCGNALCIYIMSFA